jgi:hypothetical protein
MFSHRLAQTLKETIDSVHWIFILERETNHPRPAKPDVCGIHAYYCFREPRTADYATVCHPEITLRGKGTAIENLFVAVVHPSQYLRGTPMELIDGCLDVFLLVRRTGE